MNGYFVTCSKMFLHIVNTRWVCSLIHIWIRRQFPLLFVYKQERSNHIMFQWMNQTTKRKAPSGRAVLTRTTRKDKHRKYRPISEMRNALKLNQ